MRRLQIQICSMKHLLLISLVTLMCSCSLLPRTQPVEVKTITLPAPMYHPPMPLEVNMQDLTWRVLTPGLMAEYLKLVEEGNAPPEAYYALSTQGYESLSMNMVELKRYITNVLAIIKYYREQDKEVPEEKENKDE